MFHFLIFGTVVAVQWRWGTRGVCLFGGMTSLVIAYALLRGPGHPMYEAMAREKDAPRRTHYIVVPYLATLIGGILSNVFFPSGAVLGYLVTGLGDAVAEPVGTRFGRHEYKAPAIRGVRATRSLEGSCAVFLASALALVAWLPCPTSFPEAPSSWPSSYRPFRRSSRLSRPTGGTNATLQIVPALLWVALR